MGRDEGSRKMMGYRGEGEWGLREILGGEEVLNMYRLRCST